MEFLARFLDLANEKGLTISDIAKKTKLPRSTVSSYVNRKSLPSVVQLEILADFFGVTVDYLLGRTDEDGYYIKQNAQSLAPLGDTLTQDEKDLLKFYRGLNNVQKETVAVLAESLYGKNKAEVGKIS